jgi:hypothetical protein
MRLEILLSPPLPPLYPLAPQEQNKPICHDCDLCGVTVPIDYIFELPYDNHSKTFPWVCIDCYEENT